MPNLLALRVLGGLAVGPMDAFEYYEGEGREITLQLIDTSSEDAVPIYLGAYSEKAITVFEDNGTGGTTVTSNAHGKSNGDAVNITGTTNYNGYYVISNVTTNTFDIDIAFTEDDATGKWVVGPVDMKLSFPAAPDDVVLNIDFTDFDSSRTIFTNKLSSTQTTQMISGFINFEFNDVDGNHRVAYLAHGQAKIENSGN